MAIRFIKTRSYLYARMALGLLCVMAGLDDLIEALGGVADLFHLDTHHGVIGIGILTVSKEITELIERAHQSSEELRARKGRSESAAEEPSL